MKAKAIPIFLFACSRRDKSFSEIKLYGKILYFTNSATIWADFISAFNTGEKKVEIPFLFPIERIGKGKWEKRWNEIKSKMHIGKRERGEG
jgi:hypothetical protein